MSGAAWIVEVGARGPLGLNSLQVITAARAGKREVREASFLDQRDRWVGSCRARFLPGELVGLERLVRLGAPALREAGRALRGAAPLVIGMADEARPDVSAEDAAAIVGRLAQAAEIAIDEARSSVIREGHASFAAALEKALALLEQGAPAVLVGGVDSLVSPTCAAWLDAAHRLHAEGTEDGIIPSEAAAFALVVPGGAIDGRLFHPPAPAPLAAVRFARTARDESALDPEGPTLAEPLTQLVQSALASLDTVPSWLFTDLDEMHRLHEWSRVELRCHPVFEEVQHDRIPDLFGDIGAATGALAAAYACRGWALGGAPRGAALTALTSDGALRGAFALEEAR